MRRRASAFGVGAFGIAAVALAASGVLEPEDDRRNPSTLASRPAGQGETPGTAPARSLVARDEPTASVASDVTATDAAGTPRTGAGAGAGRAVSVGAGGAGGGAGSSSPGARATGAPGVGLPAGYTGEAFRGRVPAGTASTPEAAALKAAQLERAADVAQKRGTLVGKIESVAPDAIAGWAYAWDDPAETVGVEVFVDGVLVSQQIAGGAPGGDATDPRTVHRWRCPPPASLADGDRHTVVALALRPGKDGRTELTRSPWTYGGRPRLEGQVALVEARVVYGWARNPAAPATPLTVEVIADGKSLGTVTTRPGEADAVLAAAVTARAAPVDGKLVRQSDDHPAFVFAPTVPIDASLVQVRILGPEGPRELAGSPVALKPSDNKLPEGAMTFVNEVQISGYAYDLDVLPAPTEVDVLIDGEPLGRFPADKTFAVLPSFTSLKEPEHAFTITPPERYRDGKTHTVQVFAVNHPEGPNREVKGSPATFFGRRNSPPIGFLDGADTGAAKGWAYDPDAGANPVDVEIWLDGALHKRVPANGRRPDLVPIATAEPDHGFVVPLPDLSDGKPHTVRAYAINVPEGPRTELSWSPRELNVVRPRLGIYVDDSAAGIRVTRVEDGLASAAAGVLVGDIIRAFDGVEQRDATAFIAAAKVKQPGEKVTLKLYRDPALDPRAPDVPQPEGVPLGLGERVVVVTCGQE